MAQIKQFEELPQLAANGDFSAFKQTLDDLRAQGEGYVRDNPTQSVLYALAGGFILRLLPIGLLISVLVRLSLFALRPALFIYGAVTLYKKYGESQEHA